MKYYFFPSLVFLFILSCDSSDKAKKASSSSPVIEMKPQVLKILPHDSLAFTQGLLFKDKKLFESTGLYEKSSLRRLNPENGRIEQKISVPKVFAEGLAYKDNRLIQLTWRSGVAFIYTYPALQKVGSFSYRGEGWGLTTTDDHSFYIMSNGSDTLYWRDDNFKINKRITVTLKGKPLSKLNELEYARNKLYANVWYSDFIFEINPNTGMVLRIINCQDLINEIGSLGSQDVLNGIAYNKDTDTFFITGKNWPVIYEVAIPI